MGICFGTVRVKTNAGEVVGTVRVKEGEQMGTIRYMGTVKFKDGFETIESEASAPVCYMFFIYFLRFGIRFIFFYADMFFCVCARLYSIEATFWSFF
jgi:hypothetical protein